MDEGIIIDQLPALSLPVLGTDELPVERGTSTYKTTMDDLRVGLGVAFRNVTPSAAAPIETVCPWESSDRISYYYVTGGMISDQPFTTNATAYVMCFGGSANNHVHILVYTSNSTAIGRIFIHTMQGGSNEGWREITAA